MKQCIYFLYPPKGHQVYEITNVKKEPYIHLPKTVIYTLFHMSHIRPNMLSQAQPGDRRMSQAPQAVREHLCVHLLRKSGEAVGLPWAPETRKKLGSGVRTGFLSE